MRFTIARYLSTGRSKLWPLKVVSWERNWPVLSTKSLINLASGRSPTAVRRWRRSPSSRVGIPKHPLHKIVCIGGFELGFQLRLDHIFRRKMAAYTGKLVPVEPVDELRRRHRVEFGRG